MKFLTIDASKSINPGTGEHWYKANVNVSVDKGEVPEDVFRELKKRLDEWLPNPFEIVVKPVVDKDADAINNKLFEETKKKIISAKTKEAAGEILISSGFKLRPELQQLVNMKPSNGSKKKGVKML